MEKFVVVFLKKGKVVDKTIFAHSALEAAKKVGTSNVINVIQVLKK